MERAQIYYVPGAHEQQYYEGLYQMADTSRSGNIGGAEAVAFFSRSRLQVDTLKNIWTLADQPSTNSLDRKKFATAIRLIQLSQNGLKAQGSTLGGPPGMRPAMFDGVSGVTVQLPPPEPAGGGGAGAGPQGQAPSQQIPQAPSMQTQSLASVAPSRTASFASIPPSPGGNLAPAPPVMTTALATQDPYILAPQEQSRYGDLFPNYAKEDGYIYGREAVELFSKSGVPQDQLKQIWNMVDYPVDNRLDKLEFSLAMHLIVCVSKKGLPLPTSLPVSLKSLKSKDSPTQELGGPPQTNVGAEYSEVQPLTLEQSNGAALSMNGAVGGGQEPQVSVPPPLPDLRPSGLAISDAFEGLSTEPEAQGYTPPEVPSMPTAQQEPTAVSSDQMHSHATKDRMLQPAPETVPQPHQELSVPQPMPAAVPNPTEQLSSSYNMGDDSTELSKLKANMQKLQAENIALKAQMGNMTEEEKEIKRETVATVEEIARLSSELTDLRAQVLATKSRLLESTAELTAAKEKKSALSDLIAETKETSSVLQQAENDLQNAHHQALAAPAPAPIPPPVAEADLFGGWDQPAPPANAPAPAPVTNVQATNVESAFRGQAPAPVPTEESPAPWNAANAPPSAQPSIQPPIQAPAPVEAPAPAAPIVETASYESEDNYNGFGAAPLGSDSSSLPPNSSAQAMPTQQFQQQLNLAPNNMIGGVLAPPVENNTFGNGPPPIQSSLSAEGIENMKESARRAEQTSQEAEETYRALASEVEQLREIADQAEANSKEKAEKASKKKGLGKKKASKEAEQAEQEAAEKKKHFLEMQAQASNAQALAMESKRETERLRDQAEQAELDFVSSESTRYSQPNQNPPPPSQPIQNPPPQSQEGQGYGQSMQNPPLQSQEGQGYGQSMQNPPPQSNGGQGYGQSMQNPPVANQEFANPGVMNSDSSNFGGMPDPSQLSSYPNYGNGYDQKQVAPAPYGNGTHHRVDSCDFGFGDGIMGGGGAAIPTPQNNDAYVNPF